MIRVRWWTLVALCFLALTAAPARAQERATVSSALSHTALQPGKETLLAVVLDVAPGFHAQSSTPLDTNLIPFRIDIRAPEGVDVGEPVYPEGHITETPQLGKMSVYDGRVVGYVPLKVRPDAQPGPITIGGEVSYQICDDAVCYQPESTPIQIQTRIATAGEAVGPNQPELFKDYKPTAAGAAQQGHAAEAPAKPRWTTLGWFGVAFVAGLLFNIMPCVLPVLPIKAKGFYEVAHHQRSQAFVYGLVFSIGLISVFAVLAVLVLVLRAITWGDLFSNPYFIWTVVTLLVFLALGMFGGYDVGLPNFIYDLQPRHDTYPGNFFWGALMAVLATPCTAPLLPPLLAWAVLQPATIGVPAVIMVGVGMASPYLILSAFPELARGIPRSGPGADLFKQMLGFMLLSAAAYFAGGRIVHGAGMWWIVTAVVAVASFYLLARTVQISKNAMPVAISAILAVAMLGGILWWTARINGLLRPATAIAGVQSKWIPYSDSEFDSARASGKPVLVKFTANWCGTCQFIEGTVFQEPRVWEALQNSDVVTFKVDLTNSNAPGKPLLLKLNPAGGIPLTAIYPPRSEQPILLESLYGTDTLLDALERATSGSMIARQPAK